MIGQDIVQVWGRRANTSAIYPLGNPAQLVVASSKWVVPFGPLVGNARVRLPVRS